MEVGFPMTGQSAALKRSIRATDLAVSFIQAYSSGYPPKPRFPGKGAGSEFAVVWCWTDTERMGEKKEEIGRECVSKAR